MRASHPRSAEPDRNGINAVLYHHTMSSASRFIRLVLGEYGLPVELTEEQPWKCARISSSSIRPVRCLCLSMTNMRVLCGATVISEFLTRPPHSEAGQATARRRPFSAGRNPPAGRVVPGQDGSRRHEAAGARADLQAADAADARRRRTGFEDLAHGARQYPPAHEIYLLARRVAQLSRRQSAELCGSGRSRALSELDYLGEITWANLRKRATGISASSRAPRSASFSRSVCAG